MDSSRLCCLVSSVLCLGIGLVLVGGFVVVGTNLSAAISGFFSSSLQGISVTRFLLAFSCDFSSSWIIVQAMHICASFTSIIHLM